MLKAKLAIIDNSLDHRIYDPVSHWAEYLQIPWQKFRAKESSFPRFQDEYTHLILTGSEASILEREDWVQKEADLVVRAIEQGVSILGSCYGHQLIAYALLGSESIQSCSSPEVGWIRIEINERNPLIEPLDEIYAFSSHFDEVVNLSNDFQVFASTEKCPVQAFQLKGKPVWGIQSHPEMNIQAGMNYLYARTSGGGNISPFKEAMTSPPQDSSSIHEIVKRFCQIDGIS